MRFTAGENLRNQQMISTWRKLRHAGWGTLMLLSLGLQHSEAAAFVIVSDGRAACEIVVSPNSGKVPEPVRFAASELQRYVRAMSDATLPIAEAGGAAGDHDVIVLEDDLRAGGADGSNAADPRHEDHYVIHVLPHRIELRG